MVQKRQRLPASVVPFSLMSRSHGYVYVFVPKAACSTMKVALWLAEERSQSTGPLGPHMSVHARQYAQDAPWLTGEGVLQSPELDRSFIFTLVRNPLSRVFAAYNNKILGIEKGVDKHDYLSEIGWRRESLPTYHEFLQVVADQEPDARNEHWRVMADVVAAGETDFDRVLHVETLDAAMPALLERLFGEDAKAAPALRVNATSSNERLLSSYTPELIDLVGQIYARDFETFGYGRDLGDLGPIKTTNVGAVAEPG